MSRVIQVASADVETPGGPLFEQTDPAIRTDTVYVVHTSIEDTLAAVRVAGAFAKGFDIPVTLVHFRTVSYALPVDASCGISPIETEAFIARLRAEALEVRVRVYLCRDKRRVVPLAFRPHSLIVVAGRRRWWPTGSERWRRTLEAAGHFVVFVNTSDPSTRLRVAPSSSRGEHKERSHA